MSTSTTNNWQRVGSQNVNRHGFKVMPPLVKKSLAPFFKKHIKWVLLGELLLDWSNIVSEEFAKKLIPYKVGGWVGNQVLYAHTHSKGYLFEHTYEMPRILEKIHTYYGQKLLDKILVQYQEPILSTSTETPASSYQEEPDLKPDSKMGIKDERLSLSLTRLQKLIEHHASFDKK